MTQLPRDDGTAAGEQSTTTGTDLAILLAEVGRAIAASLDVKQIAQTVVNQAVRVIQANRCAIYFFDEDRTMLLPMVAVDVDDPQTVDNLFYAHPLPVDSQPLFQELRHATVPLVVQDTFDDPRTTREFFTAFQTRAVLSVPLRSAAGDPVGVLGFFWTHRPHQINAHEIELAAAIGDHTAAALESARLREELQRERMRLARVVENMRDGVVVYAPNGRIEYTNELVAEMLGLQRPIVGLVDRQDPVLPPDLTPYAVDFGFDRRAVFERVLRRKEAQTGLRALVHSEPPKLLDVSYAPLVDGDSVDGVVVSFRDVTDLLEIERLKAAHEARLTLEAVIASTANGVMVYDNDARIVLANPFVHDLYGLEAGSIVGLTARELAARIGAQFAEPEQLAGVLSRIEWQQGSYSEEIEIAQPRRRIIRRVVSPVVTRDGTHVGKVAVYHDVTRERAVDRQKDEFLSLASHELKTPLTSIKGYTQVLLGRAGRNGMTEREQRALRTIEAQVDRMGRLVGELLDISRIDSGQLRVQLAPLDLTALVRDVVEQVQLATTRHDLMLATSAPVEIVGDVDRLEQVVANLLENAIKYSPGGGRIEVAVEGLEREAQIVVHDEGIGIPQEQIPHLFTRFYRAENVGSTISGLGLGLYISHQIVLRHGGSIQVTSREGRGSTFRVLLPLAPG